MAALHINSVVLQCDGCATKLNDGEVFRSPLEARAAAYAAGWRYPAMLSKTGKPLQRASDACPTCLPGWIPVSLEARPGYQRQDGTPR